MRQLIALAWKEWREIRWVIGFSLVMFIGIPLIAGIEGRRYTHGVLFNASPWVIFLGGLLATVVAATAVCRDLNGPLADFWRSRAVSTGRWVLVKYLVGLAVILVSCLVPLAIEQSQSKSDPSATLFAAMAAAWFPFVFAVQYSIGFLCGAVARRPGPAIMLALALTMLAYFLPMILPPLRSLNLPEVLNYSSEFPETARAGARMVVPWVPWPVPFAPRQQMPFLIAAIASSAAALIASIVAVRREWRIRSAQKLTYWSIALALLLVFASAAFQLATNLPVLQTADLGPHYSATVSSDGKHGAVSYLAGTIGNGASYRYGAVRSIELTQNQLQLGPEVVISGWPIGPAIQAWLPRHPDYLFLLRSSLSGDVGSADRLQLGVFDLRRPASPLVKTIELGLADLVSTHGSPNLYTVGDQLYVTWWTNPQTAMSALVDVEHPEDPRIIPSKPYSPASIGNFFLAPDLRVNLAPISAVTTQQQISTSVYMASYGRAAMVDDVLATTGWGWGEADRFATYRLKRIVPSLSSISRQPRKYYNTDTVAEFQQVGQYNSSLLENIIGANVMQVGGADGMAYVSEESYMFNRQLSRLTVFDISNPARPRPIGHFAAPDDRPLSVCPLPGSRFLVAGRKLYLLGPPH